MNEDELRGRISAIEVMLFALAQRHDSKKLDADILGQLQLAETGLLTTPENDTKVEVLKEMVHRYRDALGLS